MVVKPCLEECDSGYENADENADGKKMDYDFCMMYNYNPPKETCEEYE